MKTRNLACSSPTRREAANALLFTLVMMGVALTVLAGAMAWSATSAKQIDRSSAYMRSVAAAEAANETVISKVASDFINGGEGQVLANLDNYRQTFPSASNSTYWADWEFSDGMGNAGTYFQVGSASNYVVLDSTFAGLKGFVTTCTLISNARQPNALNNPAAGVYQQLQLARIPIFQFAMFAPGDMEIGNGQPFVITGRVHANGNLYIEPISDLTFQSDVSAAGDILYARHPLDGRPPPTGLVTYQKLPTHPRVPAMNLPIGTTNTPAAIREITQPPPLGEDPNSAIGRLRYYNLSDVVVTVLNDTNISVTSGRYNNFGTVVSNAQVMLFISTSNTFSDAREAKTIHPIDIDVGVLKDWSATNDSIRPALGNKDLSSIYVWDRRPATSSTLGAVRVLNGRALPANGLTVASASPLYVWGHYNQPAAGNLGTTNTSTTVPASLVGDAVTILSIAWSDANSASGTRNAQPTTVNAAILAGSVDTTAGKYSGGMENFPRFLETWGPVKPFTYNGSMVKMFPSLYATNAWGRQDVFVYGPPARNWAYDMNFDTATKLPPLTPGLMKVLRSTWSTIAANSTNAPLPSL